MREAVAAVAGGAEVVMVVEGQAARGGRVGRLCGKAHPRLPLSLDVAFSWVLEERVVSAAKRATRLRVPPAAPTAPLYRSALDR
jgi:hypothetical protein